MPMNLEIITAERSVYEGEVDMVIAPGLDGQLGILPRHAPLMTILKPGELTVKKSGEEDICLLYTSPSPRDGLLSRMPSSA